MGKKYVALFMIRRRKGVTTTIYTRRVGEKVLDTWEEAVKYGIVVSRRMTPEEKRELVNFGYREATEEEIREAEE